MREARGERRRPDEGISSRSPSTPLWVFVAPQSPRWLEDEEMAVWAVSGSVSDLLRMSGVFAEDGFAKEFSIWGVDSPRSEDLNVTTHGVKEARLA